MKFRLKKKEGCCEIEEILADNKKALEVFERLLNEEKKLHRKTNVKISLFTVQIVLIVVMGAIWYLTDIISIFEVIVIAILSIVVDIAIIFRGKVYLLNEIEFINGLLKERGIYEETPIFRSGQYSYIEIQSGFHKGLVNLEYQSMGLAKDINLCRIRYFKKISWRGWNHDKLFIEDKCQVLVVHEDYQFKLELDIY